jgi:hypothetical protein
MLQAILGSHPDVYTCTEPWIALPFLYALREEGSEFEFDGKLAKHAIRSFLEESGIDRDYYNSALNSFLSSLYQKPLEESGKKVFLDKTPRYYEIASDLKTVFPQAKFIVLLRHPLAILNSILDTWVKDDIDRLLYYKRDLFEGPHKLSEFVSSQGDGIHLVRYEDIVKSPEVELEKICRYIGIDFNVEMLRYKIENWTYGDKKFKEKSAPDSESINSWRVGLCDQRKANFSYYFLKEFGESLFDSLGYDYSSALNEVKKFNPNNKHLKHWKRLGNFQHIESLDEQRLKLKAKFQENTFMAWIETIRKKLLKS